MKKNAFLFLLSFILISCESEEVVVDEEHTDADGFILEYNEEEVYKEFAGAIVTNNVTVAVGQEIELAVHKKHFVEAGGFSICMDQKLRENIKLEGIYDDYHLNNNN